MKFLDKKNNSVLGASVVFTLFTFLQPALSFLLLPIYLNHLSEESYSIYTLVSTITLLVSAISGLKIATAVIPFYYSYNTDKERNKMLSNIFTFNLVFNLLLLGLIMLIGPYISSLVFKNDLIEFYPYIFIPCLIGLIAPLVSMFLAFCKNKKEIFKYGAIQLLIITISTIGQLVLVFNYKLEGILFGKLLGSIAGFIVVCIFLKKIFVRQIDFKEIKKYLNYSIPLLPFFFIFWIGRFADRFFLEKHVPLEEVGVYGLLVTFTLLITLASEAIANSIQPFLYEEYQKDDGNSTRVKNLYKLYLFALLFAASMVILLTHNINIFIDKKKYLDIIPYVYVGIIPAILNGFQYFFFNILSFHKKSKTISAITVISVSIQIILVIILVKEYKINGLIFASIIGNTIALIIYYLVTRKYLYNNFPVRNIYILISIFLASLIFIYNLDISYNLRGLLFPIPLLLSGSMLFKDEIFKIIRKSK